MTVGSNCLEHSFVLVTRPRVTVVVGWANPPYRCETYVIVICPQVTLASDESRVTLVACCLAAVAFCYS